ncbi:MAG: NAD-dependent DNA ligase LigA [Eubacteriaceae bacterium]|jgi:DNA ligase (NAD+)|nr:NAD-dependent DNA ligase LigA [Eubacteriaceae bacterium]
MDGENARIEMRRLAKAIDENNRKYYEEDEPVISDMAYDAMLAQLLQLEEAYPEFADPNSPTKRVGGAALELFQKVVHKTKQFSLANAFSKEDLLAFDSRVAKAASGYTYCVEYKFDGLTVVLRYENGIFQGGATRGDGEVGEDVTANLMTIRNIPLTLAEKRTLTVRGEVVMPKRGFERVNAQRLKEGLPPFANPRNAAAGSLRQLDPKVAGTRPLAAYIFSLEAMEGMEFASHAESLKYLSSIGFSASPALKAKNVQEAWEAVQRIEAQKQSLPYEIDGAVLKVDEKAIQEELGATSKNPRWATAYKFTPETAETEIREIAIQVGRSGALTPVAVFDPVLVSGSLITRASLHNEDYIQAKDIRVGDWITVHKAGEIIPEVVSVAFGKRDGSQEEFRMPDACPSCGAETYREEGQSARKCRNPLCPAQIMRAVEHFVSKGAANIDGMGSALTEKLVSSGHISDISDIYRLKASKEELEGMDKMGKRSVEKLLGAIESSKGMDLASFIYSLGIPFVGRRTAEILGESFESLDQLKEASVEELSEIQEIGEKIAKEIASFFLYPKTAKILSDLKASGVDPKGRGTKKEALEAIEGKVFVLTGTLKGFTRDEALRIIHGAGGKVSSSVSAKTDFLLAGENPGTKRAKAESLGVSILTEEAFCSLIGI